VQPRNHKRPPSQSAVKFQTPAALAWQRIQRSPWRHE
jgi:hypothetical protein